MNCSSCGDPRAGLAPRERALVAAGGWPGGAALVDRHRPAVGHAAGGGDQHRALDAQLQHMKRLQAQARAMQAATAERRTNVARWKPRCASSSGKRAASLRATGSRSRSPMHGPRAGQWLTQVRANARAIPAEARITRNASGGWDGSVVLTLPSR